MKNLFYFILLIPILFICCTPETISPANQDTYLITDIVIGEKTYKKIEGNINSDLTLASSNIWLLSGGVFIEEGYTLSILEGQTIYADPDVTTFLSVQQGGSIIAQGSQTNPIVFTPLLDAPTYGSWGGIIVNGYASINTGLTAEGEGGTGIYGGDKDLDNSGILSYIRVEYAGKILGTDNELNGFSFNGVGSNTTVEYIQAYKGADDGIEFFGGTVSVKYAVSTHNQDDSFDWTHGWRGKGQYWYAQQGPDGGDRGIEADNNGDDNTLTPYSNPTLSNITLLGVDDGDGSNTGMRLREGTKGKLYYVKVSGFPKYGIRVSDQVTLDNVTNGELFVAHLDMSNNGEDFKDCDFSQNTSVSNESWFTQDTTIGSGEVWMDGWTK